MTPWNFDIYKIKKITEMQEIIIKNHSKNIPFFYFLKVNKIHDAVCQSNGKTNLKNYYKVCIEVLKELENLAFLCKIKIKFLLI